MGLISNREKISRRSFHLKCILLLSHVKIVSIIILRSTQ